MNLKGKSIIVTGGAGFGVASGICKALFEYGARLIINEKDDTKMDAVLKKYPGSVPAIADVSNPAEAEALFNRLGKEIGPVHGLVNNAGVGLNKEAHDVCGEEFDTFYSIDVKGVWMMSKLFVQQLLQNKTTGNIVNVSSVHAHSTISGYAIYASAKAAVEGLTRGMAVELGKHNIRVNAIAPGYVHAEQNYDLLKTFTDDPDRWVRNYIENEQVIHSEIQPEDCGYTVAFLLSDLSRSITGQTIYIDKGNTIKLLGSLSN